MSNFYELEPYLEEFMETGLGYSLFANFGSSALNLAAYVLTALALYTLAKRRGIKNPWLSWIPVANCWIVGTLSDQYRYVVKGEVKNKRKALLILNIINAVICIAMVVVAVIMLAGTISSAMAGSSEAEMVEAAVGALVGILALCLPLIGVSIAICVIHFMAMYDIYTSCNPQNSVLFLVLSIFFTVTEPFFIFFNRKKDGGMPPRRAEPQYVPPQPHYEPPQETYETE